MTTCICGAEIAQHGGKGRPAQFCSTRCRVAAHRAKASNIVTDTPADVTIIEPRTRAPFSWFGGKQYLAPTINRLIPPHDVYVEVFGGAASLLWTKAPSRIEVYNDVDSGLVNFFRILRTNGAQLRIVLELTPYSRDEYLECRRSWQEAPDEIEQARRWFVQVVQGFSAHLGPKSGWSYSRSLSKNPAETFYNLVDALPWFSRRLRSVQVEQQGYAGVIPAYDTPETLFYCDPPYLPETRSSGTYRHELTRDDHIRLLDMLNRVKGMVILSGYRSALYDEMLATWERKDIPTINWASNKEREARTECIWLSPNIARQPSLWEVTA